MNYQVPGGTDQLVQLALRGRFVQDEMIFPFPVAAFKLWVGISLPVVMILPLIRHSPAGDTEDEDTGDQYAPDAANAAATATPIGHVGHQTCTRFTSLIPLQDVSDLTHLLCIGGWLSWSPAR